MFIVPYEKVIGIHKARSLAVCTAGDAFPTHARFMTGWRGSCAAVEPLRGSGQRVRRAERAHPEIGQ